MPDKLKEKQSDAINAQERISDLYNNAPTMFCTLDLNGYILNVNLTLENCLGKERDSLVNTAIADLIPKEHRGIESKDFKTFILAYDPDKGKELTLQKSDGEAIVVHMTWNFIDTNYDNRFQTSGQRKGQKVYGVRVSLKDVTEEHLSEMRKSILFETMSIVPRLLGTKIAIEELLEFILEELGKGISYDLGTILLSPVDKLDHFSIAAAFGMEGKADRLVGEIYPQEDVRLKQILGDHLPMKINHLFFKDFFTDVQIKEEQSFLFPLLVMDEVIGIMILDNATKPNYSKKEITIIEAFGSIAAGAIQNLLLRDEVQARTIEVKRTLDELEAKDKLIQRELDMAYSIQQGILPEDEYHWNGIKVNSQYESVDKIGGDFYDYFHMPHGELAILMADVSGHGIPAALLTTMAKISFTSAAQKYSSPKSILVSVNNEMCENIKTDDYLTVFFLIIDKAYRVSYVNAGHQVALLYRKRSRQVERLDTEGFFCGMIDEMGDSYEERKVQLEYGDRIMLYTDGIVEAANLSKEQYGVERLEKIFIDHYNKSIPELEKIILDDVADFSQSVGQKDDISLVVIELDEKYEKVIQLMTDGKKYFQNQNYRDSLIFFQQALEMDPKNLDLLLIIGEAYFRSHNFKESVKYFEKYIFSNMNNPNVYYHLALSYFKLNDFDSAIHCNKQALEVDASFVKSYHLLGLIYKKLNDFTKAKEMFVELLCVDPENKKAKSELSYLQSIGS